MCAWAATQPCPVSATGMDESAGRSTGAFDGEGTNFLLYKYSSAVPETPTSTSTPTEERAVEPMEEDEHRRESENLDSPSSQGGQGLPLPEVVMQLVKDPTILQWDVPQRCYIVIDGERFEEKFNQMRKVSPPPSPSLFRPLLRSCIGAGSWQADRRRAGVPPSRMRKSCRRRKSPLLCALDCFSRALLARLPRPQQKCAQYVPEANHAREYLPALPPSAHLLFHLQKFVCFARKFKGTHLGASASGVDFAPPQGGRLFLLQQGCNKLATTFEAAT